MDEKQVIQAAKAIGLKADPQARRDIQKAVYDLRNAADGIQDKAIAIADAAQLLAYVGFPEFNVVGLRQQSAQLIDHANTLRKVAQKAERSLR